MNGILIKLRGWWDSSDRTQKIVTLGGGGLLLALLIGTFVVASRPKMSIVFANLSPGDAGSVQMEIDTLGIPVTMDTGGNVSVPTDKVAFVRARLAQNNKLPKSPHPGYEGLTTMGMMNTPKVEEERLKSMLEGELARSVEAFDGVDTATVHLTFGETSPFASEQKPAQASITLSERSGGTVNASEGRAMATLVASSLPGMDAKKVAVFSRDGRVVYDGQSADDASGAALTKLDLEKRESDTRRTQLQQTLNRVVGPGNAIVTVAVNLNVDESSSTEDRQIPEKTPTNEQKLNESMPTDGSSKGGSPDVLPLAPGDKPATAGGTDGGYKRVQNSIQRDAMNHVVTNTKKGVGEVKSMAVTVFLNTPKADPSDTAATEQAAAKEEAVRRAVNTYLGLAKVPQTDATKPAEFVPKEGFTSEIISYPFDDQVQKDTVKAVTDQAGQQRIAQILNVVPAVVLVFLALFVFKQLGKVSRSGPAIAYAGGGGGYASLPPGPGGSAPTLPTRQKMSVSEEIRQKALEAGISEEELDAALEAAQEQGIKLEDIPSIGKRINLPLEQIRKMGEERPEVVSTLIKSWLLEDRR